MISKFEFIINAIIDIAQEERLEMLMDDVVCIKGIRTGKIIIYIKKSQKNPKLEAIVTAEVNGKSETDDILKVILYDILQRTDMLDDKLSFKLDIIFNEKKLLIKPIDESIIPKSKSNIDQQHPKRNTSMLHLMEHIEQEKQKRLMKVLNMQNMHKKQTNPPLSIIEIIVTVIVVIFFGILIGMFTELILIELIFRGNYNTDSTGLGKLIGGFIGFITALLAVWRIE